MDDQVKDLKDATSVFTKELLNLKRGEKFLIYLDQGSDHSIVKSIQESAQQIGALPELFEFTPGQKLEDVEKALVSKIEAQSFDVICELSEETLYSTQVWGRALELGSRLYSLSGMEADGFFRCFGKVDHDLMFQFAMRLREILKKAKTVQILTPEGTDLRFKMKADLISRIISKLLKKPGSVVWDPSGKLTPEIKYSFVGGQLAFQGIPETIEGVVVFDGYLWPPKEIGRLDSPVTMKIKKGSVVEIGGCPDKSKILDQWFGQEPKKLQHFCFGFNPGAKFSGKLMEAERAFGCFNIGIGKHPFHIDGVIKSPSVLLDGEPIVQNGSFVSKELPALKK